MVALASAWVRLRPEVDRREYQRAGDQAGQTFGAAIDSQTQVAFKRTGKSAGAHGDAAGAAFGKGFGAGFESGGGTFARVAATAAARATLFGAAAGAAAPGVLQLTAALAPAAGALLAMPAAMLAVRAASVTMKIAVAGVGDAISEGITGTSEQAAEALKKLPPGARAFAREVIALKPQVEGLRKAVAGRFFAPLTDEVQPLARLYMPMLRREMSDLAGPLGGLGEQFAETAQRGLIFNTVKKLLDSTRMTVVNLRGAVDPLIWSLAILVRDTVGELPKMADGFARAAERFSDWVADASDAGKITQAFRDGVATVKDLGGILANVGSIFGSVMRAAGQGSASLLSNVRELTGEVAAFFRSAQGSAALTGVFQVLGQFGAALRTSLGAVLPAIAQSITVLAPAIAALAGPAAQIIVALAPLLPLVAGIAAKIIIALTPAIAALAGWLERNAGVVKVTALVLGGLALAYNAVAFAAGVSAAGGLLAWAKATTIGTAAAKIATVAQYAFGAALRFAMGPIGIIITAVGLLAAAVVYLWKNNETFRTIVMAVWAAIKNAVSATVSWITGTAVPWLVSAWNAIAAGAMWLWRNVIQPVWNGIKTAIDVAWVVIKAIFNALMAQTRLVAGVITWLYESVVRPVWSAISKAIDVAWLAVRVVFEAWRRFMAATLGFALGALRDRAVEIFEAIRGVISRWWNTYVKPIFNAVRAAFNAVADTFRNVHETKVKPLFAAVATTISAFWNTRVRPVFDAVKAAWRAVATAFTSVYNNNIRPLFERFTNFIKNDVVNGFRTGTNLIRTAWDKVKEYARKPVAFVVNSVINPFVRGLNKAAGVVGLKDRVPEIQGFASGGQIPGAMAPGGRDNRLARVKGSGKLLAVASKEFVTNTKSTMANLPLVKAINAKRGKVTHADVDPYLDGGDGRGIGDGIGGFFDRIIDGAKGVANFVTNPKEGLRKIAYALLDKVPGEGYLRGIVVGAGRKLVDAISKFTEDKTTGGFAGIGNGSVLGGWQGMRRLISARFPNLGMISGFRPGARTLSGNPSYHGIGRAVDYPPNRALAQWIRGTFGSKTKELITPFQDLNLLNGRPHRYTGAVWNQHNFAGGNAHVHWSAQRGGLIGPQSGMPVKVFDSGGAWPSGTLGANLSGRTEYVDANRSGTSMADVVDRLDQAVTLLAGLGYDIVEAQRVGTRRTARISRGQGARA